MSEQKHTPGPWAVDPDGMGTPWNVFAEGGEINVAIAHQMIGDPLAGQPERTANAHLIAAAPDLLAAQKSLAHMEMNPRLYRNRLGEWVPLVHECRAAIAKAEGR